MLKIIALNVMLSLLSTHICEKEPKFYHQFNFSEYLYKLIWKRHCKVEFYIIKIIMTESMTST